MARTGRFDDIRDLFAPELRSLVAAETLEAAWSAELERLGPLTAVGVPLREPAGAGAIVVKVPVTCERGALVVVLSLTAAGMLGGIQLAPPAAAEPIAPWQPPPYVDPTAFDERDVTLGSGPLAVAGTLSLPNSSGVHPAVVFLAGSGVLDRDETIGRNKPFKDLAWGLASHGVAVLRFDKVTFTHPDKVRSAASFTVADEYMPHALAAIELLATRRGVDPERIFLLGHSLGGTVAPRLAAHERRFAGLAILAGGAEPLQWSMVRQVRYLASLDEVTAASAEGVIEALVEQARLVDSPELSESTPPEQLPFGTPASYWLDLRAQSPVAVAASLDRPILLLQGGRDYQVTIEDDLERWKAGLAGRRNVTVHVYPADNHLFFSGTGLSTPGEYEPVQHVDPTVVTDLVDWLTTRSFGPTQ
jgi:dienelactone hydrolase